MNPNNLAPESVLTTTLCCVGSNVASTGSRKYRAKCSNTGREDSKCFKAKWSDPKGFLHATRGKKPVYLYFPHNSQDQGPPTFSGSCFSLITATKVVKVKLQV